MYLHVHYSNLYFIHVLWYGHINFMEERFAADTRSHYELHSLIQKSSIYMQATAEVYIAIKTEAFDDLMPSVHFGGAIKLLGCVKISLRGWL